MHQPPMAKPPTTPLKKPAIIDLFAGVGGLSLGAARAGFDVRLAVEKDPKAYAAHAANFPGSRHSGADISKMTGAALLSAAGLLPGQVTGIIGGPPCQGFSNIGRRQVGDSRNLLFKKFFSLVKATRPKFFLAENVPGIMNACYDGIREEALAQIEADYIMLDPFVVKASDYGAATARKRVIFFGYLADETEDFEEEHFTPGKVERVTVATALQGLPATLRADWDTDEKGWRKVRGEFSGGFGVRASNRIPDGVGLPSAVKIWKDERRTSGCIATTHERDTIRRFDALEPGKADEVSRCVRLDPAGLCPTIRAGTDAEKGSYQAVRPVHPTQPRVITPREAARLQGFPDWFRFDPTKWHSFRQIGNSVSPILAESLMRSVVSRLG